MNISSLNHDDLRQKRSSIDHEDLRQICLTLNNDNLCQICSDLDQENLCTSWRSAPPWTEKLLSKNCSRQDHWEEDTSCYTSDETQGHNHPCYTGMLRLYLSVKWNYPTCIHVLAMSCYIFSNSTPQCTMRFPSVYMIYTCIHVLVEVLLSNNLRVYFGFN